MDDCLVPDELQRADAVLTYVKQVDGVPCVTCGNALCGHQAVMNLVAGFKDAPRCLSCLATALDRDRQDLRDHLYAYLHRHECYRQGWRWASGREGFNQSTSPACLWGQGKDDVMRLTVPDSARLEPEVPQRPSADAEWDAGDMGCGDLVLELRRRLLSINPGKVLKVTASDPGAPEDLPAWCRLTGHILAHWSHPDYWIRRKEG